MENELNNETTEKDLLPVGTIIKMKRYEKKYMIVGHNPIGVNGMYYDYYICRYPEGIGGYSACMNTKEIEKVYHLGYVDDYDEKKEQEIKDIVQKNKIQTDEYFTQPSYENPVEVLPIGSLVKFNDTGEILMIAAHASTGVNGIVYDYEGYRYPDGDAVGSFDHKDIDEIVHVGYIDQDCYNYMIKVEPCLESFKKQRNSFFGKLFRR